MSGNKVRYCICIYVFRKKDLLLFIGSLSGYPHPLSNQSNQPTQPSKVRKLEFLLADAVSKGASRVVTIGGIQSNHCRATAVSAAQIGLEPHVILRDPNPATDPGLAGNLGLARLAGARVRLVQVRESERTTALAPTRRAARRSHNLHAVPFASSDGPWRVGCCW